MSKHDAILALLDLALAVPGDDPEESHAQHDDIAFEMLYLLAKGGPHEAAVLAFITTCWQYIRWHA